MSPELHHPVRIDRIAAAGLTVDVEASPPELASLARRMQLAEVRSFGCRFTLRPGPDDTFLATGHLKAVVVQTCVVTLEDFAANLEERFVVRFVPSGAEREEIDVEAEDEIPYEGDTLDLGEAAAEQLALSLDPYPRCPGAELPDGDSPAADSEQPFAALRRLQ